MGDAPSVLDESSAQPRYFGTLLPVHYEHVGGRPAGQAPIKVNERTKERIRYLAAMIDATQAEIVDRAMSEYAVRHADEIAAGIERARAVLASGDAAIAACLLHEPCDAIERVADPQSASADS